MRHFSRNRITGKSMTYEDVVTTVLVWQIPLKWTALTVCDWLQRTVSVSLASVKERGSEEAIFPARGQKATSENDVTRTDGAGSLYVHAARCAGQTYKTPAAHTVHTLKLYLYWAYIGRGDISGFKGKQLFIYVALAIGWIGYDHQKSCWDLGIWSQK